MTYKLCTIVFCLITSFVILPGNRGSAAEALDHAAALAPFVNDDTFFAAYLNLAALPTEDGEDGKLNALLPYVGEDAQAWLMVLERIEQLLEWFRAAGVDALYGIAGLGDVNTRGGPVIIFHVPAGVDANKVAQMLGPIASNIGHPFRGLEARTYGQDAVLVGSAATLDRYTSLTKSARPDLVGPLEKLVVEGAVVVSVFCPGPDFRRVVRELWPELPGPLVPLRGELADRWLHLEAAVNLPPDAKPRLALQAKDAEAAALFAKLWQELPTATTEFGDPGKQRDHVKAYAQLLIDTLSANVEGTRVTIELPTDETRLAKLRAVMGEVFDASMESTRRDQRIRQFKELAIAMLNHHDVHKHLPASAAIRSPDGKPLLSWRVAVLPYLEENELYKQFHLDEPWDSPHNRRLIEKMPAIYADPDPKLKHLARQGKTTYQVPVAPETIFFKNEGTTFRDINDGTSKTIQIVEVEPLRAVVWTKPEDWEVDVQQPLRGVERTDRPAFIAAFADGHVEVIPVDVDFRKLRGLLTRAGGEVFDWP